MDATLCTVILLYQRDRPYVIADNDQGDEDTYHELLQSTFGKVYVQQNHFEVIQRIKQSDKPQSTLLLVDLDAISSREQETQHSKRSRTLSLLTPLHHHAVQFVKETVRAITSSSLPNSIPPIVVCSRHDSPTLMLDCINAGATDYILKPLYPNVIKTLFLKLHRHLSDKNSSKTFEMPTPLPTPPPVLLPQQQSLPTSPTLACRSLCDRINELKSKETYLSQILMDNFVPKTKPKTLPNLNNSDHTISNQRLKELEANVHRWEFDPFTLSQQELLHCVFLIFDQVLTLPALAHLSFDRDQFHEFIRELASVYHAENPYHNFAHAVDVLQCLFYMLCQLNILPFHTTTTTTTPKLPEQPPLSIKQPRDLLRPQDVFALLIAAIGHDAGHPGVNNMFLVNSTNPLATLYNDRSVLESLHSMTLFQLLYKHQIIQHVGDIKSSSYKEFRKIVVSSILATDMSLHLDYVSQIKEQAHRFQTNQLLKDEEQERVLLCTALIKCADISNVARPFALGRQWATLLVEEFVGQGDLEKELDLPVLPMNDRDRVILEDSQIGFIRFVALGLFETFQQICGDAFSFTTEQMKANLQRWEDYKRQGHETKTIASHAVVQHDSGVSNISQEDDDEMSQGASVKDLQGTRIQPQEALTQRNDRRQENEEDDNDDNDDDEDDDDDDDTFISTSTTQMITAETGFKRPTEDLEKANVKRPSIEKHRTTKHAASPSLSPLPPLPYDLQPSFSPFLQDVEYNEHDRMLEMQPKEDCLYSSTLPASSPSSIQWNKDAACSYLSEPSSQEQRQDKQQRQRAHSKIAAYCQCCVQ
ncbi:hypothetical protein BDF20DRAFT_862861 [Mycotypha africana]|uniref:uncharacterized protein n=1 Tax=Mycotypha africana TaxID=64632 RepID=UPI002301FCF1|nr:uncharacterized protein BDF20DRAFT_862861 [Mycotypha africana]KAI8981725.1 hypothetical protein BDF20DRAFT_862861 [Mycotypha africana]